MKICKTCKKNLSEDDFYTTKERYFFPYCKSCTKIKNEKWKKENKKSVFKHSLKRKFKISLEFYEEMRKKQNNSCAICNASEESQQYKVLSIDHDHITGKVRGLLCSNCNHALGKFQDSVQLLENAITYLKRLS